MRKFATRSLAVLALAGSPALAATPQDRGFWQTPTIHGYGKIHYLPDGAYKPRADQTYKIVFSLTQASKRSEEHTSELQSLMSSSYAVFCLKKNTHLNHQQSTITMQT